MKNNEKLLKYIAQRKMMAALENPFKTVIATFLFLIILPIAPGFSRTIDGVPYVE